MDFQWFRGCKLNTILPTLFQLTLNRMPSWLLCCAFFVQLPISFFVRINQRKLRFDLSRPMARTDRKKQTLPKQKNWDQSPFHSFVDTYAAPAQFSFLWLDYRERWHELTDFERRLDTDDRTLPFREAERCKKIEWMNPWHVDIKSLIWRF